MALVGTNNPNLMDVASRTDADGKIATIVELLSESNEVVADMTFIECNNGSHHKTVVRTGLPSATWRMLNYGVAASKSRTAQVSDSCGMLEAYSKVDKALADLSGNTKEFRASEDKAFLEAMNQEFVNVLFYGNTSEDPEKFLGLSQRFSSLSAENGQNIITGGGAGSDNTSIWLICWGPTTIHGIYPKGSKAGLSHEDLGVDTLSDGNGGEYQGYRTHYKWDAGLTLRDWRYVVRIANIDVSELVKNAATGADLIDLMVQAIEKLPNMAMGRPVFYCNRTISSFLRRQLANKSNVHLSMEEAAGKKVLSFDGIPVRRVDAILNTEAAVS